MSEAVLWLRAVKSVNPLATFQGLKRQEEKRINLILSRAKEESIRMLWYLALSWPDEGPLNEVEAKNLASSLDIILVADDRDFLVGFLRSGADTCKLNQENISLPEGARDVFLPSEEVVAFRNEQGSHMWIKERGLGLFDEFCECMLS